MRGIFIRLIFVIILTSVAFAQSTEPSPKFDAADVHVSPKSVNPNIQSMGGFARAGRYQFRNATMVDLIASAYSVDPDKILGGPSWLETDRFDILAKAPTNANQATARLMLRSLLAERFKLVVHNEDKPVDGFVMTVAKPGQLKQSTNAGPTNCQGQPQPDGAPTQVIACKNITMAVLAQALRQIEPNLFTTTVTDLTQLEGSFDFELRWTPRGAIAAAGKDAIPIQEALEKQLGIKVDAQKRSLPTLIVDSVSRKPTDNVQGVEKMLPTVSTEFEVADVKPSAPNTPMRGGLQPGGRIDLQGATLKQFLMISFGLVSPQNPQFNIAADLMSGPKFLDTDHYDIVAKAPADVALSGTDVDVDTLLSMLRTLFIDRFKMKFHTEDQPTNVLALVVSRQGRMKQADPASRSKCTRKVDPSATGIPLATLTCQNTTMAQLAEKLPAMAPAYFDHPAIDGTGLEGGWDFVLPWTPRGNLNGGGQRGQDPNQPGAAAAGAAEPNGALTLPEGLERIGLKLEPRKAPYPVFVIDHIEQKPTDN